MFVRSLMMLIAALCLSACRADVPDGVLACGAASPANEDCPLGWSCRADLRCYRAPVDADPLDGASEAEAGAEDGDSATAVLLADSAPRPLSDAEAAPTHDARQDDAASLSDAFVEGAGDAIDDAGDERDADSADGGSLVADPATDGAAPECSRDADCVAADAVPKGCAEGRCAAGICTFIAVDQDHDGEPTATCGSPTRMLAVGADCDDADPDVAPAKPERCNNRDDDCDQQVDEDIAVNTAMPCKAGLGVCEVAGSRICIKGVWDGCSAVAGAPQGADKPRCDNTDYDCDGVLNSGCVCLGTQTRACVQRCSTLMQSCSGGEYPACDPEGGVQPAVYCLDDDNDGHLGASASCRSMCPPGGVGSATPWIDDARWRLRAATPQDDCDPLNGARFPGNPDSTCDGTDQDCSDNEPNVPCGRCGEVACGASCPRCPGGYQDNGAGSCEARSNYGDYMSFGDADRGPWPGDFNAGASAVPGASHEQGHFEVHLQYPEKDAGSCCWENTGVVAHIDCSDGYSRALLERDYPRAPAVNVITIDVPGGTQCYVNREDNKKYCCCGCARRHTIYAWVNAGFCL